jgi:dissimilatory sulfite reductase (desulfoviridin) alpha/beta subunit
MAGIPWEQEAERQLQKLPFFLRPLVRKKVEERVQDRGRGKVTLYDYQEAESRFRAMAVGKEDNELKSMMPQDNVPGADTVVVETCHGELRECPNLLLTPSEWREAIENWLHENRISERLRARIKGDKVLFHHKFRISISGCPNACSRPQIADLGLVGFVQPEVDPAECKSCGACQETCPDAAIIVDEAPPLFDRISCLGCKKCHEICPHDCIGLSEPGARIMAGGKLGRHPRLAEVIAEAKNTSEMIKLLERMINDFIERSGCEERFGDYWARNKGPDRGKKATPEAAGSGEQETRRAG